MNADATFLGSDYNSFVDYATPSGLKPFLGGNPAYNASTAIFNASGKQLVNAPAFSFIASGQKDFDLADGADVYVRGEYQYTAKTYFDPTNLPIASRPSFSLVNASIGYSPAHSHLQIALWGKNLANTQYINGGNYGSNLIAPIGEPRTFGVRVNYTY